MRDREISSSLGRPMTIKEFDCDVEPLTSSDFSKEVPQEHILFVLHLLSVLDLMTKIVNSGFAPGLLKNCLSAEFDIGAHINPLDAWASNLPESLRICPENRENTSFWAYLLHLSFK